MIQNIKRYLAIRSYMKRLSGDLVRRFGQKAFYKVEHVTQAVQRGGFSQSFIAYAHAAFCEQNAFDAHYGPLGVACTYLDLRRVIARRYFSNRMDFDAQIIFNQYGHANHSNGHHYESGLGTGGTGGDGY